MGAKKKPKAKDARVALTLRFTRVELDIMKNIFIQLAGHADVKKGCRDVIVNVMNQAIKDIQQRQEDIKREQSSEGEKLNKEEDVDGREIHGDVSGDNGEAPGSGDADTSALAESEDAAVEESGDGESPGKE